jgi:hypothetical protein
MVDSSVELSAAAPVSSAAEGTGTSAQPLLRRSLSSEYFAGKGVMKVAFCSRAIYITHSHIYFHCCCFILSVIIAFGRCILPSSFLQQQQQEQQQLSSSLSSPSSSLQQHRDALRLQVTFCHPRIQPPPLPLSILHPHSPPSLQELKTPEKKKQIEQVTPSSSLPSPRYLGLYGSIIREVHISAAVVTRCRTWS